MAADTYITNAIQYGHDNDTDIIYGVVRNVAKQVRDVVAGTWDSFPGSGSLDDYDISAAVASGGLWSGNFPEIDNGFYIVQFRIRAVATPDYSDILLLSIKGYWNGAIFAEISEDQIVAAIKAITGITEGGTWTWEKVMTIMAAFIAGNWRVKTADSTKQELMDAENGTTVILEQSITRSPAAGSKYRDITVKI